LPGRILDARHAILDRAEEILTRPSCDEHRALKYRVQDRAHA
jgi:hypothetical protein